MGSMGYSGVILIAWFVFGALGTGLGAWLVRQVWKRRKATSRAMTLVTALIAGSVMLGAFGTLLGLVKAFGALGGESADPSQKARVLAEGVAEAMNCTAFGFTVAIPSTILALGIARFRKDPE